ncbi:hypothetical protein [Streptomyces sp. NRRL B-1347]|uniref:hypothetical protein n=1 Tax=Streptomyces sp. NRRL B-1347 TaxID=1476877 RepID=UPI00131E7C46|nr:hypothetical protein [Streptomyces sp. NRRL B-1347]
MTDGLVGALIGGGVAIVAQLIVLRWQRQMHRENIQARINEYRHDGRLNAFADLVNACKSAISAYEDVHHPDRLPVGYTNWRDAAMGIMRRIDDAVSRINIVGPLELAEPAKKCQSSSQGLIEHVWDTSHLNLAPKDLVEQAESALQRFTEQAREALERSPA